MDSQVHTGSQAHIGSQAHTGSEAHTGTQTQTGTQSHRLTWTQADSYRLRGTDSQKNRLLEALFTEAPTGPTDSQDRLTQEPKGTDRQLGSQGLTGSHAHTGSHRLT